VTQTHDHDHDAHAAIQSSSGVNEFEVLEQAVRELAIEKGLFSAEDHRRFSEWAESIGPSGGSKLVAKAWVDPQFNARLLADGTEGWIEEQLAAIITRDTMIGVAQPKADWTATSSPSAG